MEKLHSVISSHCDWCSENNFDQVAYLFNIIIIVLLLLTEFKISQTVQTFVTLQIDWFPSLFDD